MNRDEFHEKLAKAAYDYRTVHSAFPSSIIVRKERIDEIGTQLIFTEWGNPTVVDFILEKASEGKSVLSQQHQIPLEQADGDIDCKSDDVLLLVDGEIVRSEDITSKAQEPK